MLNNINDKVSKFEQQLKGKVNFEVMDDELFFRNHCNKKMKTL